MNRGQVQNLIDRLAFPFKTKEAKLIETHISWVILTDAYVYKIKRPVTYSFLDFTDQNKRLELLNKELTLNQRLAKDMYLDVLPIIQIDYEIHVVERSNLPPIDHALLMKRMDEKRQLDLVLQNADVSVEDIQAIADVLIPFHLDAKRIDAGDNAEVLWNEFSDILSVEKGLLRLIGPKAYDELKDAVMGSKDKIFALEHHLEYRHHHGFVIDGHGDLHCRNILMTDPPTIFDCIEFNDDFREIDILSEIAFLCMDLERLGRQDLSQAFLEYYVKRVSCMTHPLDDKLYAFYKMHRAGVQLKVRAIKVQNDVVIDESFEQPALVLVDLIKTYLAEFVG